MTNAQFIRQYQLTVQNSDFSKVLDLSQLHFKFSVRQTDIQTPNTAIIRIYNMAETTVNTVCKEFAQVTLQAGYQNNVNYGVIFNGTIQQIRRGRENPTDTYMELLCSDGDLFYSFGNVNLSIAGGSSPQQRLSAVQDQANEVATKANILGIPTGYLNTQYNNAVKLGPILPRGKVMYGMMRDQMRTMAKTGNWSWSIQNGQLVIIDQTQYRQNEAVILTKDTGLIGMPEQTPNGIEMKCLLNAGLKIGCLVQLNNKSIQSQQINLAYGALNNIPPISADGYYKILVAEHEGDTRGQSWYTDLTCLAVDISSSTPVQPFNGSNPTTGS